MNGVIERKGPRLGLITTEGHEDAILIGRGAQWTDGTRIGERRNLALQHKPAPLVERDMIVGVAERVDSTGTIIRPLDADDVRAKLRQLVDSGARAIAVSLLWSFANPEHERAVPRFLREDNTGGSAEIFRPTASRTFNGGPVAGLMGSFHIGQALGYRNVIASDVGGTSFDTGMVVDASVRSYEFRPIIDKWMVGISMLQTTTMGAGGGSIAWINDLLGGRLEVGPRSAGSYPGPVCYDLGGSEPTVTDADVVLRYIAPDGYFGRKMPLNRDKAVAAIQAKIAKPLGVSADEAAALIRRLLEQNMASAIQRAGHP